MSTLPVPYQPPVALPVPSPASLVDAFLSGRNERTHRAYARDLKDFAAFLGQPSAQAAADMLIAVPHGTANFIALSYKTHLLERKLAPATVNRRLAALRSLVQLGRTLGLVSWTLEVEGVKAQSYRDTRGPGRDGFRGLLAQLDGRTDAKALRDRAILRLLYDLGLRRAEVCGLDVADYTPEQASLMVLGKGRTQKERLTVPRPTGEALRAWLAVRPVGGESLFVRLNRAGGERGPLDGGSIYRIVRGLGEQVGTRARPHGLRHAAISRLLDLTNGNVREVQKFSRHANVNTLMLYDDARLDRAGRLADQLSEDSAAA